MLVLSRTRDETIMIGDDVQITVVDIRGDKVRLGITAPAEVPVHRKEVYEAIKRENAQAARMGPGDVTGNAKPPSNKQNKHQKNDKNGPRSPGDQRQNDRQDRSNDKA